MNNLAITYKAMADLLPYINNAKKHSADQVAMLAASIKEFGFNNPILTDGDNGVIAGHGRLQAAQKLGLETVPTIELSHLSGAQKKAYILADNRLGEVGTEWDMELVNLELEALSELDFDLSLTGFELELGDVEEIDFPELADGDREPFTQKTFTLHDEQAAIVDDAILKAKTFPQYDAGLNENSNGNAIAYICEQWMKTHG